MALTNPVVLSRTFLADMIADTYFPRPLIAAGQQILVDLCAAIERERPADDAAVLALTHAATERFNELADGYDQIETVARDTIAGEFEFILATYGYDIHIEDATAPRDW